jgi:beta-mannanase
VLATAFLGNACGAAKPPAALESPHAGVYFGAKAGPRESDVAKLERLLGRKLAIRAIFVSWEEQWPDERVRADHRNGRLSLVTWAGTDLGSIAAGACDTLIRERAHAVKNLGFPIFVRWGAEMNGDWHAWGKQPTAYVDAWRRIHTIFEEEGAPNVAWVWSPSIPQGDWDAYYPGDSYVDWIGGDSYNWGLSRPDTRWQPFAELLAPFYKYATGKEKPLMLAEIGSAEQGGRKSEWVQTAFGALEERFPAVKAWIHQQYEDGEADWRVNSSPESLAAYRQIVNSDYLAAFPAG